MKWGSPVLDQLVKEHNCLMDDDDVYPPHGGWAECNCSVAERARAEAAKLPGMAHYGKPRRHPERKGGAV